MRNTLYQLRSVTLCQLLALLCLALAASAAEAASALAIVSDRSAPVMAAGAHRYLERHPEEEIRIRSVSQINDMDDSALAELVTQAPTLVLAGVFGDPVERLLALPRIDSQQRLVFHSDRRLYALHRDAQHGQFTALSEARREQLFSRPPTDRPFAAWLVEQQQTHPEFAHWLAARSYWQYRNADNLNRLWQLLLQPEASPEPAQVNAPVRAWLGGQPVALEQLATTLEDRPTLFVLDHETGDLPGNWALHQKLCAATQLQCVTLLAAWGDGSTQAVARLQRLAPATAPWAILSLQDFVIGGGEGREAVTNALIKLNVPLFKGIRISEYSAERYRLSADGIPTDSIYYRVAMPELQGIGQAEVLALASPARLDPLTGVRLSLSTPLDSAVQRQIARIQRWLALQFKANADKRVAIIYYNHPPGRHNIGADNLNVPESLWQILTRLQAEGYDTGPLPESPAALLDLLQARGVNLPQDRQALEQMAPLVAGMDTQEYQHWFATLPQTIQQEMVKGPLGYLHARLQPLLADDSAQPLLPDLHQAVTTLLQRTLGDIRHTLDGVRDQRRERALDLLAQLDAVYARLLADDLDAAQRHSHWQQADALVAALVHMGIEGLRGWGDAPGRSMIWQQRILLPGIQFGNIFVGPQPPRGWELNEELLHANMTFPPPHQYLAFYHYLHDRFKADALIHLGRHSTYEFLPRRSLGLDEDDYPSLVVGDLPSLYPYIVDGVGEGIQAKRRGKAVIIDHLTPPLAVTELYDDLLSIRQLIESAEAATDTGTRRRAVADLRQQIDTLGLRDELIASMDEELKVRGIGFDQVDDAFLLHEVGHYLTHLQESFMPLGLHTFGRPWSQEAVDTMLDSMNDGGSGDPQWRDNLTRSPQLEMDALLNALNGGFVAPGKGNDPIKTPAALPTGRNFHALDGSLLPTPLGYRLGAELAAEARRQPLTPDELRKKEAVILWASDAVRDEGAMIGFGLDMLGVRPIWNSRGIIKGLERLPLDQERPRRRDVLFTTSGLFRDLYGRQLKWLDEAVLLALAASEEVIRRDYPALIPALDGALNPLTEYTPGAEPLTRNLVAANWVDEARERLRQNSDRPGAAGREASYRVFGSAPGAYGAGVNRMVERSGSWQQRQEVGQAYIARLGHAYGIDLDGASAQQPFIRQLDQVGRSYLGRASHLYGLIDNNDAFDYLGGLNLAVETVTGTPPRSYVVQHADRDNARLDPLAAALGRELRGRFLNPQWIKPLMEEGYAGARTIGSEFIEYLWGWQVTSPEIIDSRVWDEVKAVYLDDKLSLGLDAFLREGHNQQVLTNIQAILLVAAQKGFWQADEQTLDALAQDFADAIIEHGIPGSGHTHPRHPVYEFIMPRLDADRAAALQQQLANSRLPEPAEQSETDQPSHIQEIQLDEREASAEAQAGEAAASAEAANSALNLRLLLFAGLALLIILAGLLRGRMGGKH